MARPLSVLNFEPTNGGPVSRGTGGVVGADTPPHGCGRQRAGAELRGGNGLIHNQGRRERIRVVDLDGVARRPGDITPIECDVCSRREPRVGGRTNEGRRS